MMQAGTWVTKRNRKPFPDPANIMDRGHRPTHARVLHLGINRHSGHGAVLVYSGHYIDIDRVVPVDADTQQMLGNRSIPWATANTVWYLRLTSGRIVQDVKD